jgi:hypothetical protein
MAHENAAKSELFCVKAKGTAFNEGGEAGGGEGVARQKLDFHRVARSARAARY